MLYNLLRRAATKLFRLPGLTRYEGSSPPPVFDHPLEALYESDRAGPPVYESPLNRIVTKWGFGYGPDSWHPFVKTLNDYKTGNVTQYAGSTLEHFYDQWQPADAQEALLGSAQRAPGLKDSPPFAASAPWERLSPREGAERAKKHTQAENKREGYPIWDSKKASTNSGRSLIEKDVLSITGS